MPISLDRPIELEEAKVYSSQRVEVRGFLYQNEAGAFILAHRPNLKSCCLGSQALMNQQLFVQGSIVPTSQAITVRGIFLIDPHYDKGDRTTRLYILDQAEVVATNHSYRAIYFVFFALSAFLVVYFFYKKRFKKMAS